MRPGEIPGREYIFIGREKMEQDVQAGKFIEHGEYKGHLYGTSAESVRSIVNAGCVCLLSPHYQAIKALRTTQLKPFIIHIKPPPIDVLKRTRDAMHARSTFDENNLREFTVRRDCGMKFFCRLIKEIFQDEEFEEMEKSAERINFLYGHFFDEEIENGDLSEALEKLILVAQRVENEPLWTPSSWVQ